MTAAKTFRETMRENNAKFKADLKDGNKKVMEDAKNRKEQAEVNRIAKAEMKTKQLENRPAKAKGPNGFMVLLELAWMAPVMLFSLVAIIGISAFVIILFKSIFFG